MKKSLTIDDLKERIGKPVFVTRTTPSKLNEWDVLTQILDVSEEESYKFLRFISGLSIRYPNVIDFRFFDAEVSEEELKEILEYEEKSKKKTGYETVREGDNYFFVKDNMKAEMENEYSSNNSNDVSRVTCANHFNDETLTKNIARAEQLKYQLRRFAALNRGIPSQQDWANKSFNKYYIKYDHEDDILGFSNANFVKEFGQIYFKDIKACKKAIEIFKDELVWYFTKFEEQLH